MPRIPSFVFVILFGLIAAAFAFAWFGAPTPHFVGGVMRSLGVAAGVYFLLLGFDRRLFSLTLEHTPVGQITSFEFGRGARRLALGLVLILAAGGLTGCASASAGLSAYCAGVSAGGRAALAELATGRPDPIIACDPVPSTPGATPGPVVVIVRTSPAAPARAPLPAPVPVLHEPPFPLI